MLRREQAGICGDRGGDGKWKHYFGYAAGGRACLGLDPPHLSEYKEVFGGSKLGLLVY